MFQATIIQATISLNRLPKFWERLSTGSMVSDSSLMIRFNDLTSFEDLTDPVSPLPEEVFRFRNQTELIGLANKNTHLPYIIGEIIGVKSTVSDPLEEKNRVMVTIKLDNLFDSQAVTFHKQLEDMRGDPKVIVATNINPKMVGGRLFLNATSGTHIYFDKETSAGEIRFYQDTGLPSAAPLLRGYAKVEPLTIAELHNFIITAPSQEIDFLCTGRVAHVDTDKGWCYVACSKCSKKMQRTVSAFTCERCNNSQAVGSLRYRVEMTIADETAEGTFVWFDGAEDGMNPEDSKIPPFIEDMEGNMYTFQVRVNAFNFTENHKTFTRPWGDDDDDNQPDGKPISNVSASGMAISNATSSAETDPGVHAQQKTDISSSRMGKKARVA
ncbi:hypothetical protein N665_0003s0018 [Sinapis alba]|nr:hypothetical protein N665_0003s0018 [Sinapis alba]